VSKSLLNSVTDNSLNKRNISPNKIDDLPVTEKKQKYRIPKSPIKKTSLGGSVGTRTPHIPFNKESNIKVVSIGKKFSKHGIDNQLSSSQKISFEDALDKALAVSSRKNEVKKTHPINLTSSFIKDRASSKEAQKTEHNIKKNLVATKEFSKSDTFKNVGDKKPVIKPLFKTKSTPGVNIKLEKSEPKSVASHHSNSDLKSAFVPSVFSLPLPVKLETPNRSSVEKTNGDKEINELDLNNSVRGLPNPVPASSECEPNCKLLTDISDYLSSGGIKSVQAIVEPIKRSETHGYYTSSRSTGNYCSNQSKYLKMENKSLNELTDIESTDVESEDDNLGNVKSKNPFPTLLPTNFPTFDSPSSSPLNTMSLCDNKIIPSQSQSIPQLQATGVMNFKQTGIKPTAVVSPSRPRMPILPKPVPAAIASPVRLDKKSVITSFICSICGSEFSSRESLLLHEQTSHWRV